jgi:hypothetical protein
MPDGGHPPVRRIERAGDLDRIGESLLERR